MSGAYSALLSDSSALYGTSPKLEDALSARENPGQRSRRRRGDTTLYFSRMGSLLHFPLDPSGRPATLAPPPKLWQLWNLCGCFVVGGLVVFVGGAVLPVSGRLTHGDSCEVNANIFQFAYMPWFTLMATHLSLFSLAHGIPGPSTRAKAVLVLVCVLCAAFFPHVLELAHLGNSSFLRLFVPYLNITICELTYLVWCWRWLEPEWHRLHRDEDSLVGALDGGNGPRGADGSSVPVPEPEEREGVDGKTGARSARTSRTASFTTLVRPSVSTEYFWYFYFLQTQASNLGSVGHQETPPALADAPSANGSAALPPANLPLPGDNCPPLRHRTSSRRWNFFLFRRPLVQFVLCTLFLLSELGVYQFCEWFTDNFRHADGAAQKWWYLVFVGVMWVAKGVLKWLGYMIDMGKCGGHPFYFAGELVALVNYYEFFRSLFGLLDSTWVFVALTAVHLAYEWAQYAVRATQWYYDFTTNHVVARRLRTVLPGSLFVMLQTDIEKDDWVPFVCVEYGVRIAVMVYSYFTFIILFTFIRFSWNSGCFKFFGDASNQEYHDCMLYSALSIACELVNAIAMQKLFFGPRQLSILLRTSNVFSNPRFRTFAVAAISTCTMNVIIAHLRVDA